MVDHSKNNLFFSSYQEGRDNALVSQLIVVAVKELEYIIEFIKLDGIGKNKPLNRSVMIFFKMICDEVRFNELSRLRSVF